MPETRIDDDDREENDTDFTPAAIIRKLDRSARVLTRLNTRLAVLSAGLGAPPDPFKPTISASLSAVRAQAAETLRLADEMAASLSPR